MNESHSHYVCLPSARPFTTQTTTTTIIKKQKLTIGTKSKVAFASIQNNLKLSKIEISMKMMRCVMNLTLLVCFLFNYVLLG